MLHPQARIVTKAEIISAIWNTSGGRHGAAFVLSGDVYRFTPPPLNTLHSLRLSLPLNPPRYLNIIEGHLCLINILHRVIDVLLMASVIYGVCILLKHTNRSRPDTKGIVPSRTQYFEPIFFCFDKKNLHITRKA